MGGWKMLRRTMSKASAGGSVHLTIHGTGFAIPGENDQPCQLLVTIDGETTEYQPPLTAAREISFCRFGLKPGEHKVRIDVLSGTYCIDGVEIVEA